MQMATVRKCLVLTTAVNLFGASGLGAQQGAPIVSPLHSGAWILGGSASLSKSTGTFGATFFQVSPTALALVTPNLAIGGMGALGYTSSDNGHAWTYGIGPSARLFFGDVSSTTLPFVSLSFLPQWNKSSIKTSNPFVTAADESSHEYSFDGSIGLTRMIATHVGLTGEAYFTHIEFSTELPVGNAQSSQNQYGVRVGLTAFVR